ncbi:hypothetical protein O9929_12855 [Vibrio lentus]|nr:hypothetical protein [Vibrio lentus]
MNEESNWRLERWKTVTCIGISGEQSWDSEPETGEVGTEKLLSGFPTAIYLLRLPECGVP